MYLIDNNEILSVKKNINVVYSHLQGFQEAPVVKNPPASTGDIREMGPITGSRRSSGGGYGNPLQYSWLENPMDRGAWWAIVHRVTELDMTEATLHARIVVVIICINLPLLLENTRFLPLVLKVMHNLAFPCISNLKFSHSWPSAMLASSSSSYLSSFLFLYFSLFWLQHAAYGIVVPQPGIEPALPALEGGILTTGPSGNSCSLFLKPLCSHSLSLESFWWLIHSLFLGVSSNVTSAERPSTCSVKQSDWSAIEITWRPVQSMDWKSFQRRFSEAGRQSEHVRFSWTWAGDLRPAACPSHCPLSGEILGGSYFLPSGWVHLDVNFLQELEYQKSRERLIPAGEQKVDS